MSANTYIRLDTFATFVRERVNEPNTAHYVLSQTIDALLSKLA